MIRGWAITLMSNRLSQRMTAMIARGADGEAQEGEEDRVDLAVEGDLDGDEGGAPYGRRQDQEELVPTQGRLHGRGFGSSVLNCVDHSRVWFSSDVGTLQTDPVAQHGVDERDARADDAALAQQAPLDGAAVPRMQSSIRKESEMMVLAADAHVGRRWRSS